MTPDRDRPVPDSKATRRRPRSQPFGTRGHRSGCPPSDAPRRATRHAPPTLSSCANGLRSRSRDRTTRSFAATEPPACAERLATSRFEPSIERRGIGRRVRGDGGRSDVGPCSSSATPGETGRAHLGVATSERPHRTGQRDHSVLCVILLRSGRIATPESRSVSHFRRSDRIRLRPWRSSHSPTKKKAIAACAILAP